MQTCLNVGEEIYAMQTDIGICASESKKGEEEEEEEESEKEAKTHSSKCKQAKPAKKKARESTLQFPGGTTGTVVSQ